MKPFRVLSLIALATLFAVCSFAQMAQITGRITDTTKAVMPNVNVEVTNVDTGVVRKVQSNNEGYYTVPLLPPGVYKMTVRAEGFRPVGRDGIRLEINQVARFDFELEVGPVTQSVEVIAGAQVIQSEITEVGQVIDNRRILDMPLNGRNYMQLATLTAGVTPHRSLSGQGNITTAGAHRSQTDIQVDGNDNAFYISGGPLYNGGQSIQPPVDSLAEFKVITNNMSAEHGYRAGAKVMVSTRSGTNEVHGSLYEFLRNDKFDGTNFFANRSGARKPHYRQNQFGGTLGGPIIKNRTFYFGSYQGTRIRRGSSQTSTVPSQEMVRDANFSNQPEIRRWVYDPLTLTGTGANAVRALFPGSTIPKSRIDPVGQRVMDMYPAPNIAGREHLPNNYFRSAAAKDDDDQYDGRLDHNFSDSHRMFVRYSHRDLFADAATPLPWPALGNSGNWTPLKSHSAAANFSATLSPTVFNEFRFGWWRTEAANEPPFTDNWNEKLGIRNAPVETRAKDRARGYSVMSITGYASLGPSANTPQNNLQRSILLANSLLIQKGAHTIKLGAEYRRARVFRYVNAQGMGHLFFTGSYTAERPNSAASRGTTGNALADLLLGYAKEVRYSTLFGEDLVLPYYAAFIQDDFKLTPRLTINAGLRWELFEPANLPNLHRLPNSQLGRYLAPWVNAITPDREGMQYPTHSRDRGGAPLDMNNFGPRLGLAYKLTNKTVVRAGAGIYYAQSDIPDQTSAYFRNGPPRAIRIDEVYPFEMPGRFIFRDGFPNLVIGEQLPRDAAVPPSPDYRPITYVGQWFADIQRELPDGIVVTVGYQGNKTTQGIGNRWINLPLTPHPTIQASERRIRPHLGHMDLFYNGENGNYHAMVMKAEKRFSRGLTFLSSFTWSHTIDTRGEQAIRWRDHHNTSIERGSSWVDVRLAYTLSALYELPFGQGKRWLNTSLLRHFVGGWQIGGLLSLYSGLPFDHTHNVDTQNNGGVVRGDWVRNPELPKDQRSIDRWFDTGFVRAGVPGQLSNAGRNLIRGPGSKNLDFIATKAFRMPWEGHTLQFRFESFNFTNTPDFGGPNTAVGTPAAGTITSAGDPRRIQFALKYVF